MSETEDQAGLPACGRKGLSAYRAEGRTKEEERENIKEGLE